MGEKKEGGFPIEDPGSKSGTGFWNGRRGVRDGSSVQVSGMTGG